MTGTRTFADRLEHELLVAIERRHRKRMFLARAAGLGVAAVAAVVGSLVVIGGQPSPALAITATDDGTTLRVVDATADPGHMTAELREAGIDGEIEAVPVDDDAVGIWLTVGTQPEADAEDLIAQIEDHPEYLTIKPDTQSVWLVVGRPARDGETPLEPSCYAHLHAAPDDDDGHLSNTRPEPILDGEAEPRPSNCQPDGQH